jgi:aminoglycoside phosphotransferase (APT) family kinase protein
LRADYAAKYQRLDNVVREWRGPGAAAAPASGAICDPRALAASPVFIGVPDSALPIDAHLVAIARSQCERDSDGAAVDRLVKEVADLEADIRGAFESTVAGIKPVAARATRPVTAPALQQYLRAHPSGTRDLIVNSVVEIPGGRSKRTIVATLEQAGDLPSAIVQRMDTGRGVGTNVSDEFPLLDRVAQLGLPVPEPLWLEKSREPFGFPFIVLRRMPGASAGDLMEGAFKKVPETGRALACALGKVHAAGSRLIEDPARRASAVSHTEALLNHYYDWWTAKKPFPSLVIEAAFIWLRGHLHDGLGDATVVHADTAFHNLLLDDAGNVCLLDWEFAHFGDGAEDLASCRPAVERCMPWQDFMDEYQKNGGKPVSEFRLNYFEIWRPLRNAVVCGTVLHSLMNGEADDVDPVTIALSTFARLQADLARSLASIAAGVRREG